MLDLLRKRDFRLLWIGQLCSQFGDRLTQLVLIGLAAVHASGSTLTLAKVMVMTSLPALLLGPFAGVYVDRWDRKQTMIACDLIRVAAILALPWAAASGRIPLYLDTFLLFSVGSFFVPARLAIIPDVVPPGQLGKANALFTTSGMIGSALILLVGALLVERFGAARASWVNGLAYAASAVAIALIRSRDRGGREPAAGNGAASSSAGLILAEIWEGIRQLWLHDNTRRVMALLALLVGGAGASMVIGAVLVQSALRSVTKDLGFLSLWFGVGIFLGTVAHGRYGTRQTKRRALGAAFIGCGFSVWLFLVAVLTLKSGVAASFATGLLGFFVAPVGIVTNTLVHEAHPERLQGRIFSSLGVVFNLSLILSMLAAGWLAERGGRGLLLGLIGAAFAAAGAALLAKHDIVWAPGLRPGAHKKS